MFPQNVLDDHSFLSISIGPSNPGSYYFMLRLLEGKRVITAHCSFNLISWIILHSKASFDYTRIIPFSKNVQQLSTTYMSKSTRLSWTLKALYNQAGSCLQPYLTTLLNETSTLGCWPDSLSSECFMCIHASVRIFMLFYSLSECWLFFKVQLITHLFQKAFSDY